MIVTITKDAARIKRILTDPEIWPLITDDSVTATPDDYEPPISDEFMYLMARENGEDIGLAVFEVDLYDLVAFVHIQVLPPYRKQFADQFAGQVVAFGLDAFERMYADVPVNFPNVIKFAERHGFVISDTLDSQAVYDGVGYDVVRMRHLVH